MESPVLKYFKIADDVQDPVYSTEKSGCFDLKAYLPNGSLVRSFGIAENKPTTITSQHITILTPYRYLIPIGIIFDIPEGYSVRIHPRSGLALKFGLAIPNSIGIIDEDYVDPVYMMAMAETTFCIAHGDRICQAELVKDTRAKLHQIDKAPEKKSSRDGGLGHTGV